MLNTIRSATRTQPLAVLNRISCQVIRLRTLLTESGKQEQTNNPQNQTQTKPKDTMSSFGEGYATRSDEEGFGGIYGGNKEDEEKIVHGNTPEYDNKQGSEVKQKEKARNQPDQAA